MKKLILSLGLLLSFYLTGWTGWFGGLTSGSSSTVSGSWNFDNATTKFSGDIELTSGGSITSTANGDITLTPNGTGDVNWTSQNSTMTTAGALSTSGTITAPNFSVNADGLYQGNKFAGTVVSSAVTNTTSETTLWSTTIPANTIGASGVVRVTALFDSAGAAGNYTTKVKLGGTVMSSSNFAPSTSFILKHEIWNTATNAQINFPVNSSFPSSTALLVTAIDTTAAQTLSLTETLSVATDTVTLRACMLEILK